MLCTRDPPQNRGHIQMKVKGWKKIFHTNRDQKKAEVAILISDKIDFKTKVCVSVCFSLGLSSMGLSVLLELD